MAWAGAAAGAALAAHEVYQDVYKHYNLDKVGKNCLDMEVRFTNASERALGLVHSEYLCLSTKKLDKDCLGPGATARERVTKFNGELLVGGYGPYMMHVWCDGPTWVGYVLQNPLNGSPEGAFEVYSGSTCKADVVERLANKERSTNWFESKCERLTASYTPQGEDAIIWTITFK
jgi:hypothetical protein